MAFYKITYNDKYRVATLHNYGCTFRCPVCSYKLRSGAEGKPGLAYPKPKRFLTKGEIENTLAGVDIEKVCFMGGEPTVAADLPEILKLAKTVFGVSTWLGHTNGSKLPLPHLDGANVGLKAWDEKLHEQITGRPKRPIFDNVTAAFEAGTQLRANVVFVPGLVDVDQVGAIAAWLSRLSPEIPFRIMGYIPVPGQPFLRPTVEQMHEAAQACRKHLSDVSSSHLDTQQAMSLSSRDDRFDVRRIA